MGDFQLEAQRRAVRALAYSVHVTPYILAENQIEKLGSPKLAILPSPQALSDDGWQELVRYVEAGGNLLITGPVDHDDHWQIVHRSANAGLQVHLEPLVYHNAAIRVGDRSIPLAFGQQQQNWLESLRFDDGSTFREISRGKGRIFWAAYPVELSEDIQSTADLYAYVAARAGLSPMFTTQTPVPPGVLVFPTELADAMFYVFVSDSADDAAINVRDRETGVPISFTLPSQHAALAVIGKQAKKIVARYGF